MEKRVALVTGGLSGIGKGTVLELSKKGYDVVIFDIQDEKADAVIELCKEFKGNVVYKHCDLFKSNEIKEGFDFIQEKFGRLDCAFNNAGFGILSKPFGEVTEKEIDMELSILVKAHMMCMIHELRMMKENGYGRIVNTTSGAGLVSSQGMALYSACKHAISGLTKGVALDYATQNITVNAIAPGTIETELILPYKETKPDEYAMWAKANPSERFGQPYDIARVVVFLFEEDSDFINGTIIPVDSGCVAGTRQ